MYEVVGILSKGPVWFSFLQDCLALLKDLNGRPACVITNGGVDLTPGKGPFGSLEQIVLQKGLAILLLVILSCFDSVSDNLTGGSEVEITEPVLVE